MEISPASGDYPLEVHGFNSMTVFPNPISAIPKLSSWIIPLLSGMMLATVDLSTSAKNKKDDFVKNP